MAVTRGRLLLVLLGLGAVQSAVAQSALIARPLPDPNLRVTIVGSVSAIVRQSDGKLIVGGNFRVVDSKRRFNLARFNADGTLDTTWVVDTDLPVNDLALDASDNLFVGGGFTMIDGVARNAVAKLSPDGTVDPNWNPAPNSLVSTVLLSGNQLYIGGVFGNVGGTPRSGIARVSSIGTGALDATWNPAPNGQVRAIVESAGNIYIGGGFSQVSSVPRSRLAKVSASSVGALDMAWNPGADLTVFALELDGTGGLIVGGQFSNVGGLARNCIAKLDPVGTGAASATWLPVAGGFACGVNSLANDGAGGMLVGGFFASMGGQVRNGAARVLDAGTLDANWNPDVQIQLYTSNAGVQSLLPLPGGFTQIGGQFDTVSGGRNFGSARLTPTGARDPTFTRAIDGLGQVRTIAQDPVTGAVYVGGFFGLVDSVHVRRNLLKLTPALTLDTTWTRGVNSIVDSMLVDSSQRLYVGGSFSQTDGVTRNRVARFDSGGALDTTWDPNGGAGTIEAMALTPDGSGLYLAGTYNMMGGQTRNRLARVSTTGSGSPPDAWDPNANSAAFALDVRPSDGTVFVGGAFTMLGATARNYVAKISSVGVVDPLWNPNMDNWVTSLRLLEPPVLNPEAAPDGESPDDLPDSAEVDMCGVFGMAGGIVVDGATAAEAEGEGTIDANAIDIAGPPISINLGPDTTEGTDQLAVYGRFPVNRPPPYPPGTAEYKIAIVDPITGIVTPIVYEYISDDLALPSDPAAMFGFLASPPTLVAGESSASTNGIEPPRYFVAANGVDAQGNLSIFRVVILLPIVLFSNGFE